MLGYNCFKGTKKAGNDEQSSTAFSLLSNKIVVGGDISPLFALSHLWLSADRVR